MPIDRRVEGRAGRYCLGLTDTGRAATVEPDLSAIFYQTGSLS